MALKQALHTFTIRICPIEITYDQVLVYHKLEDPANMPQDHLSPKLFPQNWSQELAGKAA